MKLNTLLLASAATVMATSVAFAADLPSKKAAPASGSVQVCKVGGMTGFTLPGSDTCVSIGGRVTFDASYDLDSASNDGSSDSSFGAGYRLSVDARSNTEMGVVRSFIQLEGGSALGSATIDDDHYSYLATSSKDVATTRRAYIQFAGLTVGKKDSLADVYGTQSNQLGLWGQQNLGVDYKVNTGGLTFGIGLENANNNDAVNEFDGGFPSTMSADHGDRPDIVAQIAGSAGPIGFKVAAVSHESYDDSNSNTHNGYALMGNVNAKFDAIGVFAFGGTAKAAGQYIAGNSLKNQYNYDYVDVYNDDQLESSVYGGGINFTFGKTFVNFEAAMYEHKQGAGAYNGAMSTKVEQYDVYLSHELAKNLTIQPEYLLTRTNGTDAHSVYLRIQRDF